MRELKFRAWNKYHNKMHSVYEINFEHSIAKTRDDETGGTYTFGFIDLDLMQFTGMVDMHGNEIYEGDILERPDIPYEAGNHARSIICFVDGEFRIKYQYSDTDKPGYDPIGMISGEELVGNIHQNPELLTRTESP